MLFATSDRNSTPRYERMLLKIAHYIDIEHDLFIIHSCVSSFLLLSVQHLTQILILILVEIVLLINS